MDGENVVWIVIAAIWLLSQLASYLKKQQRKGRISAPAPAARTPARSTSIERSARGTLESLGRFETRIASGLPEIDEKVRAQVMALVDAGFRDDAQRLRRSIESALTEKNAARLEEETAHAQRLLADYQGVLKTAGILSSARRHSQTVQARLVADRLLDEIDAPLRSFARIALLDIPPAPPAAVVLDPTPNDAVRRSPLAASTVFVPHSVIADPVHWSLIASGIAGYLASIAPRLYQEIWERLGLQVTDAELASSRDALAQLLFGSYLVRIVEDAVGATLFGPSYARALARLHAEPQAASRTTTIYLNHDGTIYPEPPAHLRIHLVVSWLTQMGLGGEAEEVRRVWDEEHGYPPSFAFYGRMSTIPADVLLDTATGLMAALEELELQAFSSRTLTALPGISDWSHHLHEWSAAKTAFLSGEPSRGSARALIAAAMDAALEAPDLVAEIRNALYGSIGSPDGAKEKRALVRARGPAGIGPMFPPEPREVIEALMLGEILLERRHG